MGAFEPVARPWNFNSGETTTHVPGIAIACCIFSSFPFCILFDTILLQFYRKKQG